MYFTLMIKIQILLSFVEDLEALFKIKNITEGMILFLIPLKNESSPWQSLGNDEIILVLFSAK